MISRYDMSIIILYYIILSVRLLMLMSEGRERVMEVGGKYQARYTA